MSQASEAPEGDGPASGGASTGDGAGGGAGDELGHDAGDGAGHPEGLGDDDERREYARAPIELKVEYKKLNTFFADYTKNICKGGTFIKTRRPLDRGTEFLFKLVVPRLEGPLEIRGEVKWVVREGEPAPPEAGEQHEPGMGIRFLYATDAERQAIESVVERLMIDSLGQLLYSKLMGKDRGTR